MAVIYIIRGTYRGLWQWEYAHHNVLTIIIYRNFYFFDSPWNPLCVVLMAD